MERFDLCLASVALYRSDYYYYSVDPMPLKSPPVQASQATAALLAEYRPAGQYSQ